VDDDGQKHVISLKEIVPTLDTGTASMTNIDGFWCIDSLIGWLLHLVQAVRQLHAIGVIHRDIKPANILLKRGPGQSRVIPFVLDYNSASDLPESDSGSGTPRYLPPEVKLGKRVTPAPEDDLWAVAMVGWEMLFGQSATPDRERPYLSIIKGIVPASLVACLSRALSVNRESRFHSADEFAAALDACIPCETIEGLALRNDDIARARVEMSRIRQLIGQVFAPPGQIVVPKDIDDAVNTIFDWLSHEDTQALNLVDEIVKLGTPAIPACLQQGYRLHAKLGSYDDIVVAVGKLSAMDRSLAERSIDAFALSSNRGVRQLCWRVCEKIEYFPEILQSSLTSDESILLPEERLTLAELCIRFSSEPTTVPALVKYMCREYILDKNRYHNIRTKVSDRMFEVKEDNTAQIIWDSCRDCVWKDLDEFAQLPAHAQQDIEGGLIEVLADAFAATPDAGFYVLRLFRLQRHSEVQSPRMFRRFAIKAGLKSSDVRAWLTGEAARSPADTALKRIAERLSLSNREAPDDPAGLFAEYLRTGNKTTYNKLRFLKSPRIFEYLGAQIDEQSSPDELDLILKLLRGFETRHRERVVKLTIEYWPRLSCHDYKAAAEVLSAYQVPAHFRGEAVDILGRDLRGPHQQIARQALEKILN
jgi:hypothetical protein